MQSRRMTHLVVILCSVLCLQLLFLVFYSRVSLDEIAFFLLLHLLFLFFHDHHAALDAVEYRYCRGAT